MSLDAAAQEATLDHEVALPDLQLHRPAPPMASDPSSLDAAARLLAGAKDPVVIAGRVGLDASATPPLVEIVELLGAAYSDDKNIVAFPTVHPQNLTGDPHLLDGADVVAATEAECCIDDGELNKHEDHEGGPEDDAIEALDVIGFGGGGGNGGVRLLIDDRHPAAAGEHHQCHDRETRQRSDAAPGLGPTIPCENAHPDSPCPVDPVARHSPNCRPCGMIFPRTLPKRRL